MSELFNVKLVHRTVTESTCSGHIRLRRHHLRIKYCMLALIQELEGVIRIVSFTNSQGIILWISSKFIMRNGMNTLLYLYRLSSPVVWQSRNIVRDSIPQSSSKLCAANANYGPMTGDYSAKLNLTCYWTTMQPGSRALAWFKIPTRWADCMTNQPLGRTDSIPRGLNDVILEVDQK